MPQLFNHVNLSISLESDVRWTSMEARKPNCCQNEEWKLLLMLLIKITVVWGLSFLNQCLIDKTLYQCIRLDDWVVDSLHQNHVWYLLKIKISQRLT